MISTFFLRLPKADHGSHGRSQRGQPRDPARLCCGGHSATAAGLAVPRLNETLGETHGE